jgi:hypothetical protein
MVWIATALNQVDGELNVISLVLLAFCSVVCLVRNSHDSIKIQKGRSLLWVTKLRMSELIYPFHFMCCLLGSIFIIFWYLCFAVTSKSLVTSFIIAEQVCTIGARSKGFSKCSLPALFHSQDAQQGNVAETGPI